MGLYEQLSGFYSTFIFIFTRFFALFISMPLIGSSLVPLRLKIIYSMLLSLTFIGLVPVVHYQHFSHLVLALAQSFFTGIVLGLVMQIPFQAFVTGGQIMAYQMGLGFAMIVDPISGINTPSVSQFYFLLIAFTFFIADMHLSLIRIVIESFEINYVNLFLDPENIALLSRHFSLIFTFGLQIALTIVFSMLITNIALALMTKAAPAINIFSIGFPLMIITGIALIYMTFFTLSPQAMEILDTTLGLLGG